MFDDVDRVFPSHIGLVRLGNQRSAVAATTIGNQGAIHLVYLVVLLLGSQLLGHLVEDGITLRTFAKGVIVDGLAVEQVVLDFLVVAGIGMILHRLQMVESLRGTTHLHVHLQTLLRGVVIQARLLAFRHTLRRDSLVDVA